MANADLVCDQAQRWALAGTQVTWYNHHPASTLALWYRAAVNAGAAGPIPAVGGATNMVCFELPIFAAAHARVLDRASLWNFYHEFNLVGRAQKKKTLAQLITCWYSPRKTYGTKPKTMHNPTNWAYDNRQMKRGDIVFFNDLGHVAIATGSAALPGQIVSVWGMDPIGITPNTPIEVTTVEAVVTQIHAGANMIDVTVTYSAPVW